MTNLELNPRFATLGGYPFARLRSLLDGAALRGLTRAAGSPVAAPRFTLAPSESLTVNAMTDA